MSSKAVAWALAVYGISPRAKLILLGLADSANSDTWSCFPGRKQLAIVGDCSLNTVDRMLLELADAGLVSRAQRSGERGLISSLYTLHPTPVDGGTLAAPAGVPYPHGRGYPTPTVGGRREPSTEPRKKESTAASTHARAKPIAEAIEAPRPMARVLEAVKHFQLDPNKAQGLVMSSAMIGSWVRGGCDLEADVIPTIEAMMARRRPEEGFVRSWGYFSDAVKRATAARLAAELPIEPIKPDGSGRPRQVRRGLASIVAEMVDSGELRG